MSDATAADLVRLPSAAKGAASPGRGDGLRSTTLFGLAVTAALLGGAGYWIATTSLAGAVIAGGTIVVESNVKSIQHQAGGIVSEINVRNGDHVEAGAVLLRLDETTTRSNLEILSDQLNRVSIRRARLEAEIAEAEDMTVPPDLEARKDEPRIAMLIAGERALFLNRRKSLESQITALRSRNEQYRQQIVGLGAQREAADRARIVLERDLITVKELFERKLVPLDRLSSLELRIAESIGEIGRLTAAIAEVEGRISENALQVIQLEDDFRKTANAELRETEAREAELAGRRAVALDQQARTAIRAPLSGTIQGLTVFTVGGVVTAGQTLMTIVPKEDTLVVDAQVHPARIDEVVQDQAVTILFSAFDRNTTPECHGKVDRVSPDLIRDETNNIAYYGARILIEDRDSCLGEARRLVPGMPVEVHIRTGERSVLSYLTKPLLDQFNRAGRE